MQNSREIMCFLCGVGAIHESPERAEVFWARGCEPPLWLPALCGEILLAYGKFTYTVFSMHFSDSCTILVF